MFYCCLFCFHFLIFHIREKSDGNYIFLPDISLSTIPSRSSRVCQKMAGFHLFYSWVASTLMFRYIASSSSIHVLMGLNCFHTWAIVTNAAWTYVCMCLSTFHYSLSWRVIILPFPQMFTAHLWYAKCPFSLIPTTILWRVNIIVISPNRILRFREVKSLGSHSH